MLYLTYIDPATKKEVSTQVVRCLTIGRGHDVDIFISNDSFVSRLHALVVPRREGRLEIRDLASTYGTFVIQRGEKRKLEANSNVTGGIEKGRAILIDGESFFIGNHEIKVRYEELLGEPTIEQDHNLEEEEKTDKVQL